MPKSIRTFIAIELPEHIIGSISKVQKHLQSNLNNIKWVAPKNIHLTLRFLGDVSPHDLVSVGRVLSNAVKNVSPFSLFAKGIGAFPNLSRPRVIWIGIAGHMENLKRLYGNIGEQLESVGIENEKRKFAGHLTVGRVKGKIDPILLINAVEELKRFETQLFTVNHVILFESELNPKGAVYTKLFSAEL